MKSQRWSIVAFVFLIIGMFVSVYLVVHHYDLFYGRQESKSICNVNALLDCDAVNTSNFSEVFGIPVALFSAVAYLVELMLVLGYRAFGEDEKQKLGRYYFYLSIGNVVAAVLMAYFSSAVLHTYCLMCLTLYVVCIATFFAGWNFVQGPKFAHIGEDIAGLFKSSAKGGSIGVLVLLISIPAGAALIDAMWRESMAGGLDKMVAETIEGWKNSKPVEFKFGKPHEEGNPNGKFVIVEFSDFQCPHCKKAAPSLHAFVNAHKDDVRFVFQNYPLDMGCNPTVKRELHTKACDLAKAAMCAGQQNKFTPAHDWIFDHQVEMADKDMTVDKAVTQMASEIGVDKNAVTACMQDQATKDELAREIDQGTLAGIDGTPTIFVNGKYLAEGFLIPVLEAAYKSAH